MGWVKDLLGKTAKNEARKEQAAATARSDAATQQQMDFEKKLQERQQKFQDTAWGMSQHQLQNNVDGALPQAQSWLADYLGYLKSAPDTTYNAERGAMERGVSTAADQTARMMRGRGLGNSGLAGSALGNLAMKRAGMLGQIEGARNDRRGQMMATGNQVAQGWLDKWLNLQQSAAGMPQMTQTQVPGMNMQTSHQVAQNAQSNAQMGNPLMDAIGGLAGAYIGRQMAPRTPAMGAMPTAQSMQQPVQMGINPFNMYTGGGLKYY